jgi:PQQ enzyme repeat
VYGCGRVELPSGEALLTKIVPRRAFEITGLCLVVASLLATGIGSPCVAQSVLSYHGSHDRSGNFVVPRLTWDNARSVHLDEGFRARVSGHVYAQPLVWRAPGATSAMLLVATESNVVYALDAQTGREIWRRALGKPIPRSSLSCGNINPLGITGTPVIDEANQTIFVDSAIEDESGQHHLVFGLALKDGSILEGWPVDVAQALARQRIDFLARDQNQRGALAILDGTVFVPFGGHFGDCGQYHGIVVGISLSDPRKVSSWATRARGGGIWAPGGLSTDGKSLFAATGNTIRTDSWGDGEAVIRLAPDLRRSTDKIDFFAPSDWRVLDSRDADLGGTNPIPLDLSTSGGTQKLIIALGKDGKAYLLDRNNLGGIGGALVAQAVAQASILGAPAAYPSPDGMAVAFAGTGAQCPSRTSGTGITVLNIQAGSPPNMMTAWCGTVRGRGSPIATTTDGRANPIVWTLGAEGDNRLHGFRGDRGELLITTPTETLTGLRHFQTLIATPERLFVGADDGIYAFTF